MTLPGLGFDLRRRGDLVLLAERVVPAPAASGAPASIAGRWDPAHRAAPALDVQVPLPVGRGAVAVRGGLALLLLARAPRGNGEQVLRVFSLLAIYLKWKTVVMQLKQFSRRLLLHVLWLPSSSWRLSSVFGSNWGDRIPGGCSRN